MSKPIVGLCFISNYSKMEIKQCPICKTTNPIEANFCRHCRYEFAHGSYIYGKLCNPSTAIAIGRIMYGLLNRKIRNT